MHLRAITASMVLLAGVVLAGSSTLGSNAQQPAKVFSDVRTAALLAEIDNTDSRNAVGLVPSSPRPSRQLHTVTPTPSGVSETGVAPVREVTIPATTGALGIPEQVLAAYRNAELALGYTDPQCGLSWDLLAGIGKIESDHASGGRVDNARKTTSSILGPTLDGHLPGNEVVRSTAGGFTSAVGPMQFLPETWKSWAADGNVDGVADPHNVFDASLAAGKYLCSGGLDLRDAAQELQAVLRYNHSLRYAADVLGWSLAYRSGRPITAVDVSGTLSDAGDLIHVNSDAIPVDDMASAESMDTTTSPTTTTKSPVLPTSSVAPLQTRQPVVASALPTYTPTTPVAPIAITTPDTTEPLAPQPTTFEPTTAAPLPVTVVPTIETIAPLPQPTYTAPTYTPPAPLKPLVPVIPSAPMPQAVVPVQPPAS